MLRPSLRFFEYFFFFFDLYDTGDTGITKLQLCVCSYVWYITSPDGGKLL